MYLKVYEHLINISLTIPHTLLKIMIIIIEILNELFVSFWFYQIEGTKYITIIDVVFVAVTQQIRFIYSAPLNTNLQKNV